MDALSYLQERYHIAAMNADPRTNHWLMVEYPWPMLAIVLCYLVFVKVGPDFMQNKKPLDLTIVMKIYNFCMILLNFYIAYEILMSVISLKYTWICDPLNYSTSTIRLASAVWFYYFSKIIELLDTVIFILRKKNSQVTFLHVYHHATMVLLWWIGTKWYAGGSSFFCALINSFVHVIMYSYYFLSAFGDTFRKYLWWKKYLTMLQLVQFMTILVHVSYGLYINCDFDKRPQVALVIYLLSHILLFSNFYRRTYSKKKNNDGNDIKMD